MSKSLGNVIDPNELIAQYGLEPVRFYLLRAVPSHADGDFSRQRFEQLYTAELANGIGNLASRVAKLAAKNDVTGTTATNAGIVFDPGYSACFAQYQPDLALNRVMEQVAAADAWLADTKPWQQSTDEQLGLVTAAVRRVVEIAHHLQPFMPETAAKLLSHFRQPKITALTPLFPRLTKPTAE